MEGASSISTIVGLFLLGGASVGTWCYMDRESKLAEVRECRGALKNLKESFEGKTKALEAAKSQLQAFQDVVSARESLKTSIASLQQDRDSLQAQFVEAIKAVRIKSIGEAMPELLLPSGVALQQVTLQKVSESGITLAHTGGVTKLLPAELPKHLRQKFRPGMFPMSLDVPAPAVVPPVAPSVSALTALSDKALADSNRAAAHIAIDIADLEKKIALLSENRDSWQSRATSSQAQANQAQTDGRPSYTYSSQAATAIKNIEAINAQIYQMQSQITALRKKAVDSGH